MRNPRSVSVVALGVLGIAFSSLLTVLSGTASADTGACISFLEDIGEDNTTRNEICAHTELLGDTVSPEYALDSCTTEMDLTGLPEDMANYACELAVAPSDEPSEPE